MTSTVSLSEDLPLSIDRPFSIARSESKDDRSASAEDESSSIEDGSVSAERRSTSAEDRLTPAEDRLVSSRQHSTEGEGSGVMMKTIHEVAKEAVENAKAATEATMIEKDAKLILERLLDPKHPTGNSVRFNILYRKAKKYYKQAREDAEKKRYIAIESKRMYRSLMLTSGDAWKNFRVASANRDSMMANARSDVTDIIRACEGERTAAIELAEAQKEAVEVGLKVGINEYVDSILKFSGRDAFVRIACDEFVVRALKSIQKIVEYSTKKDKLAAVGWIMTKSAELIDIFRRTAAIMFGAGVPIVLSVAIEGCLERVRLDSVSSTLALDADIARLIELLRAINDIFNADAAYQLICYVSQTLDLDMKVTVIGGVSNVVVRGSTTFQNLHVHLNRWLSLNEIIQSSQKLVVGEIARISEPTLSQPSRQTAMQTPKSAEYEIGDSTWYSVIGNRDHWAFDSKTSQKHMLGESRRKH